MASAAVSQHMQLSFVTSFVFKPHRRDISLHRIVTHSAPDLNQHVNSGQSYLCGPIPQTRCRSFHVPSIKKRKASGKDKKTRPQMRNKRVGSRPIEQRVRSDDPPRPSISGVALRSTPLPLPPLAPPPAPSPPPPPSHLQYFLHLKQASGLLNTAD